MNITRPASAPVTFGAFSIDPKELVLRCDGQICEDLTETDVRVLLCLAAQAGALVSKDDIMERVWQGRFVDDTNLNTRIRNIRNVIGEESIRTVRGRGYVFDPTEAAPRQAPSRAETDAPPPGADAAIDTAPPSPSRRWRRTVFSAGAAIVVMGLLGVSGVWKQRSPAMDSDVDFLYRDFLRDGGFVMVSNPRVYRYVNAGETPALRQLPGLLSAAAPDRDGGSREIIRSSVQYTGMGEALTAFRLHALFDAAGAGDKLEIGQSDLPSDVPRHMILLGGWGSNPLATAIVGNLERNRAWETFHRNLPFRLHHGAVYRLVAEGGEVPVCIPEYGVGGSGTELVPLIECALITKVKEPFEDKMRLVVAGVNSQGTEAAGRLVTDHRSRLRAWLAARFGTLPPAFQVLLKVPVHQETAQPGTNFVLVDAVALSQ